MTDKQEIVNLAAKLKEMDDVGRATAKIVIDVLHARSQFGKEQHERRKEEGSPSECADGSPS